jgi:secreted PhoX family phosphatase
VDRRRFLANSAALAGAALLGPSFLGDPAWAEPAQPGPGPYGPYEIGGDANGVAAPKGFTSRVVARAGTVVPPSSYTWHPFADGGATFPTKDGGWVYVSNSEVLEAPLGGVGALRFAADGTIVDAYSVLSGTSSNCAGGPTPWGTWLSCEEDVLGRVWECDPMRPGQGRPLPALGRFRHEAAAVDPKTKTLYMTEDSNIGRFYRFVPDRYPSLESGTLQVARLDVDGAVDWLDVPDPSATPVPTSLQVPESTVFDGGEGIWRDGRYVYFSTKGDDRIWVYNITEQSILPLYYAGEHEDPPLYGVDNVVVSTAGDVYVAEDGGNLRISMICADTLEVAPVIEMFGLDQSESEIAGPAFSPDGSRLYFSSPRAGGGRGITYEVQGPFRTKRVGFAGAHLEQGGVIKKATTTSLGVTPPLGVSALGLALAAAITRRRPPADQEIA